MGAIAYLLKPPLLSSLRSRLILLVLIAGLPGFVLVLIMARQQRLDALATMGGQSTSALRLVAMMQATQVETTRALLAALAATPILTQGSVDSCKELLATTMRETTIYQSFSVFDRQGKPRCQNARTGNANIDRLGQTKFFTDTVTARTFTIGVYELESDANIGNLTFGYPVFDTRGALIGVIAASVDTDFMNVAIENLKLSSALVVNVLDRDGTLVARWPFPDTYVGSRFPDLAGNAQILISGSDGLEQSVSLPGSDGVDRIYVNMRVPGVHNNALFVSVGQVPERVYAPIDASLLTNLFVLAIFTGLAFTSAWILTNNTLLKPVSAITRAAREISNGNLNARTQLKYGHGELSELARNFDAMCIDLQKRTEVVARMNTELETRVHLRTDQLQNAMTKLSESREQLRHLSQHQREMLEAEQIRLSREVHDQIGQSLTGLKIDLTSLRKHLSTDVVVPAAKVTGKITEMVEMVDEAIQTTRSIARRLRPTILDDLGLAAAMEFQAKEFQSHNGISCSMVNHNVPDNLNSNVATAAFRIVQEALTNVSRHAQATEVLIELETRDDSLNVQVRDNGRGFVESQGATSSSLGMLGMKERALALGGRVLAQSAAGGGTLISIVLPLVPRPFQGAT